VTAVVCGVLVFASFFHARTGSGPLFGVLSPRDTLLAAVLAIALSVPVAIRRRVPVRALIVVLAACVATLAVGGEITRGPFLPMALVLFLVASTCRRGIALAGLGAALTLLVVQGVVLDVDGQGPGDATAAALVLTIVWMVGYLVQQRRTHVAHVRDRVASDAVTRERLRIARELHDVVAHSMTVVTVQAGFGEYVFDAQPEEARAALGAIQAVSREALAEMQRMLCVLRQTDGDIAAADAELAAEEPAAAGLPGSGTPAAGPAAVAGPATDGTSVPPDWPGSSRIRPAAPLAPAPGLANLDRLVERTAGAGVTVSVERIGQPRGLPASLDLSAFRIVQESLTNVVKHSGADRCHVLLEYGADSLLIEVTDPGAGVPTLAAATTGVAAPARIAGVPVGAGAAVRPLPRAGGGPDRAGHGIIGMRERVSLCGGELHAMRRPGGGFVVRARLSLLEGRP
jgi:signal transduction histidine kinase